MIPSAWSTEHGTMDHIVESGYMRDDSFDFNTPLLSSTASSPTYDSCDPFTPRSGRSSPHGSSVDFSESFSSNSSFPFDQAPTMKNPYSKSESMDMPMQYSASMPLTPSRRINHNNFHGMDLDYNTMLQVNLSQQCMPGMSPTHVNFADHYAMPQDLHSSPFNMPTPSRSLPSSTPGHGSNMWPCNNDSPILMFSNQDTPSPSPLRSMSVRRDSMSPSPSSARSSRRRPVYEAQRRTMALQKHQFDMLNRKRQDSMAGLPLSPTRLDSQATDDEMDSMFMGSRVTPRARERCNFMGCTKTYQKREHLKRHQRA